MRLFVGVLKLAVWGSMVLNKIKEKTWVLKCHMFSIVSKTENLYNG